MQRPSEPQRVKSPLVLWTQGFSEERKQAFLQALYNDHIVLKRQNEIIDQLIQQTLRQERSPKSYDNPAWSHKQAHVNGYLQALNEIKDLINVSE